MKAINLNQFGNSIKAPKEWEDIEVIKENRPDFNKNCLSISLQKLKVKPNVCQWFIQKVDCRWYPIGDVFYVTKR